MFVSLLLDTSVLIRTHADPLNEAAIGAVSIAERRGPEPPSS